MLYCTCLLYTSISIEFLSNGSQIENAGSGQRILRCGKCHENIFVFLSDNLEHAGRYTFDLASTCKKYSTNNWQGLKYRTIISLNEPVVSFDLTVCYFLLFICLSIRLSTYLSVYISMSQDTFWTHQSISVKSGRRLHTFTLQNAKLFFWSNQKTNQPLPGYWACLLYTSRCV